MAVRELPNFIIGGRIYYEDHVTISTYRWENKSHTSDSLLRVSIGVLAGRIFSHIPKGSIPRSAFDQLNEDLRHMRHDPLAVGTIADANSSFSLRIASENGGVGVTGTIADERELGGKRDFVLQGVTYEHLNIAISCLDEILRWFPTHR
jgi:hypothetical protein